MMKAPDQALLATTAATVLRNRILNGDWRPGTALREVSLAEAMAVSRNTLREAFRLLLAEGLIEHRPNYGVTVKTITQAEIREIYLIRRLLEQQGIVASAAAGPERLDDLAAAIHQTQAAARAGDWLAVGSHSLAFHRRIVGFINSPRFDQLFDSVAAQSRLAFLTLSDQQGFQEPWVERDAELGRAIWDGQFDQASLLLGRYLDHSERLALAASRQLPAFPLA